MMSSCAEGSADHHTAQGFPPEFSTLLFAYLLELGFVRTALDESFRLPAEVAAFLHRHVYAQDGIAFHSKNRQRLPAVEVADGWLRHALVPAYPMILIEHNEDSSQQANACEAAVIEALAQAASEH